MCSGGQERRGHEEQCSGRTAVGPLKFNSAAPVPRQVRAAWGGEGSWRLVMVGAADDFPTMSSVVASALYRVPLSVFLDGHLAGFFPQ